MSESVPSGWENRTLGEIFEIKIGGTPSRNNPLYWDANKTSENYWVSIRDLNGRLILDTNEYLSDDGVRNSNVKLIHEGTVMMSFKLTLGRVAIAGRNLYTNEAIASFSPLESGSVDRDYLYHGLHSWNLLEEVDQAVKGVTLNKEKLANITGAFPPLPEQQKIASILTSLDTVIEKTEAQINKLKDLKKAMMQELLTKGIGHTEFKDSPIGRIPVGWEVSIADRLCETITKGTTPPKESQGASFNIPFIRVQNLDFDGKLHFEKGVIYISKTIHSSFLARSVVYPKDILMNIVGPPLGKIALVPYNYSEYNINQAIIIFRVKEKSINNEFFLNYLKSAIAQSWFDLRAKKTSGQKNLTIELCKEFPMPIPPIKEQETIAKLLTSLERLIDSNVLKLRKLILTKKALMQDLLTGKVRVKV